MGAFYSSICLPGDRRQEVELALGRWLGSRGFERIDRPALFDLDAASERAAFVLSLADWTVVLFSDFDEERRLIHELQQVPSPTVYLWVYDSTTWGFDLFVDGDYAGTYSSDPRDHVSFAHEPPGTAGRPWAEPLPVCRHLGLAERADGVATLMHRRTPFKEEIARAFCEQIGAAGALASYDELEAGSHASGPVHAVEQLLYERADRARGRRAIDLHSQRVTQLHPTGGALETGTFEIPPDLLRELARSRRRVRMRLSLLRPVSLVARAWRGWLARISPQRAPAPRSREAAASYRIEGRDLLNPRHGCRLTLGERASPAATARKPSAVFGFVIGGVTVACSARRLDTLREVVRRPDRAEVVTDELYHVGGLKARWLRFRLPPGFEASTQGASVLGLHIVQSEQALYVFLYRVPGAGQPRVEAQIRAVVESFRSDG